MRTDTLTDKYHNTIGYIEIDASGKQTAKDARFVTVGFYDPRINWTTDRYSCWLSSGNTLEFLITNC